MFLCRFIALIVALGLIRCRTPAQAAILVQDLFNYPNGGLIGQMPVPGPGGTWTAHADEGSTPIQVVDGRAVLSQGHGSGGREDANIAFPRRPGDATTYARFDLQLPANLNGDIANLDAEGSNFVHFKSNLLTTHFRARTGVLPPASGGDYQLAINANGGRLNEGIAWAADLSFDTVYRIVVSWNATTGESRLWLNPFDESSDSISNTGHSTGQRLESFALRQSSDYTGQQYIDNLVVATTFAEALQGSAGSLAGDYNDDGKVNAADYVLWRRNDGTQAGYQAWRANFAAAGGDQSSSHVAVPEPVTISLWIFIVLTLLNPRMQRIDSSIPRVIS